MICHMPFIASAGFVEKTQLLSAGMTLSKATGLALRPLSCELQPCSILEELNDERGLALLEGDPAIAFPQGNNWLEALGFWRKPTILISEPLKTGIIPGTAAAYTSLCNSLSVPLIGIVQLGGEWNPPQRRLDGLPWLGCLNLEKSLGNTLQAKPISEQLSIEEIAIQISNIIFELNNNFKV